MADLAQPGGRPRVGVPGPVGSAAGVQPVGDVLPAQPVGTQVADGGAHALLAGDLAILGPADPAAGPG